MFKYPEIWTDDNFPAYEALSNFDAQVQNEENCSSSALKAI